MRHFSTSPLARRGLARVGAALAGGASQASRTRRGGRWVAAGSLIVAGSLVMTPVFGASTHGALTYHALDGYVIDQQTPATDPPYDWDDLFNTATTAEPTKKALPSGAISSDFTRDFLTNAAGTAYVNGDDNYFATGSKDTLGITPGWQCKHTQNATDKGDFVNGYGYAANVTVGGSPHIIFFFGLEKDDDNGTNNLGFWLLQDENVGCSTSGGGNQNFTGDHTDGDLLATISYDSGGTVGTARGFLWNGTDNGGSLNTTPAFETNTANCTGNDINNTAKFCITTNAGGTRETPWWSPQKGDKATSAVLQKNVFVEGFLDITNIYDGNEPCFAKGLADTRASTSPTASLYDFLQIEAPTCGPLVIKKYFDKNYDGDHVQSPLTTLDPNEPYLPGWRFKVYADGADPTAATPLYDVTTGSDGSVTIADVPFGDYDVYEVLNTGYYNTDPGNTAMKKDITKTAGSQEVIFGNACLVQFTFTVKNVPSSSTALKMRYKVGAGSFGSDQNMTTSADSPSGYKASYTTPISDGLKPSDTVSWQYALQSDTTWAHPVTGGTEEALSNYVDSSTAGDGTACGDSDDAQYPYVTLTGLKYKDMDGDGSRDTDIDPNTSGDQPEPGLGGFEFKLKQGTTVLDTQSSAANTGVYSFSNVAAGASYTVAETQQTGWDQTEPANNGTRSVTVNLDATSPVTIGPFGNTPLTDLQVIVAPQTNATEATVYCVSGTDLSGGTHVDGNGDSTGTDVDGNQGAIADWDHNGLRIGEYACKVIITDP